MKNLIHGLSASLFLAVTASLLAAVPAMDVTVSTSSGKPAFKGRTNANGSFSTGNLAPGNYVVQFNAKDSAAVKGGQFLVVVSAGKRKVTADAVPGGKFIAGGVAMKVEVGSGLNITGQVADQQSVAAKSDAKVKIMNGKRYVWIGPEVGSHMPGRWAEEGSADAVSARNTGRMSKERVSDLQSKNPPVMQIGGN